MADTQQEENDFIKWLKWLLGLDEELEENTNNIEEIKKRYKEITGRNDLDNIKGLDEIKNLENTDKIKEKVEEDLNKSMPVDLLKDIDKIEKDIDKKKDEIEKEDVETKQKDYNKVKKAYDDAVEYKIKYGIINNKIKQNEKDIERLESKNKEIENNVDNSLGNYFLLEEYVKSNNGKSIESELNSGEETVVKKKNQSGAGGSNIPITVEEKEECKKIKDFKDIRNLIKNGTPEEKGKINRIINPDSDFEDSYYEEDEELKKQVENYIEISKNQGIMKYFDNLDEIEKAKETVETLEAKKKEKYPKGLDENEISSLEKKKNEAEEALKNSKQKVKKINNEIEKGRETIREKINEKYPESSENYMENREKMEMAVQVRKLAKDSNLEVSMVGAYNAASNYKPKLHLFGEKRKLYKKEVEAMKVRNTAKEEMLKREREGLCGEPDHFAMNLWNTIADIEKRHPISSSDKGMDFFSLSKQISDKYKEYCKENFTTEEQFKAAKDAFKEVVDNLGDSKINEKFLEEINYKFNKGIGLYLESKDTYKKANEDYAKLCSKNLIKNGLKDRYKKDKQEIKNEYKNKKSEIKNEIKEKAKVYKERKQQLKEKEKELKKLQRKRMRKAKNEEEVKERSKKLEEKRIKTDELMKEIKILKGSGEESVKKAQKDYREAKNSKWTKIKEARDKKNEALENKEGKFKEDRKNLREQHEGLIDNLGKVNTVNVKNVKKAIKSNSKEEVTVDNNKKITINLKDLSGLTASKSSTNIKPAPSTPTNPMNQGVNGHGI